jgi:hypothetical protein
VGREKGHELREDESAGRRGDEEGCSRITRRSAFLDDWGGESEERGRDKGDCSS